MYLFYEKGLLGKEFRLFSSELPMPDRTGCGLDWHVPHDVFLLIREKNAELTVQIALYAWANIILTALHLPVLISQSVAFFYTGDLLVEFEKRNNFQCDNDKYYVEEVNAPHKGEPWTLHFLNDECGEIVWKLPMGIDPKFPKGMFQEICIPRMWRFINLIVFSVNEHDTQGLFKKLESLMRKVDMYTTRLSWSNPLN